MAGRTSCSCEDCAWPGHVSAEPPGTSCLVLYRNKGDGTFEDATAAAGLNANFYALGARAGDIDNDHFPDLFVTGVGGCRLFRNTAGEGGKRKFVDATGAASITPQGAWPGSLSAEKFLASSEPIEFATSATFVDYDGDGKLDLFVCHYVTWSPAVDLSINATLTGIGRAYLQPQQFEGSQCKLYRNLGGGKFADVSDEAGVTVVAPEGTGPNRGSGRSPSHLASSSATPMAMAGPICSWPTTPCGTSSFTTSRVRMARVNTWNVART